MYNELSEERTESVIRFNVTISIRVQARASGAPFTSSTCSRCSFTVESEA